MGEERRKTSEHRQRKMDLEEADKVEVAAGVTVLSLRRYRAALIGQTQGLLKRHRPVPIEKPETLRVRSCGCYAFGCNCEIVAIRGGYRKARGWRYTKLSLLSALLLSFSGMCSVLLFLSSLTFLFLFCFCFHALVGAL